MAPQERLSVRVEEVVSPELALIDVELAARARAALPEPADTLSSLRYLTETQSRASLALRADPDPRSARRARRARPRRHTALAAAAGIGGVLVLFLADIHVVSGRPSEAADSSEISVSSEVRLPARPKAGARPTPRPKAPPAPLDTAPRRFVWAPADGASGYRFELFRGASRILAVDTRRPELTIPPSWRHVGKRQTLEPGEYRWYVWPVVGGTRAYAAIVQSKLVVDAR